MHGGQGKRLPTEELTPEEAFWQQGEELFLHPAPSPVQLRLPAVQGHGLEDSTVGTAVSRPSGFTLLGGDPGTGKPPALPAAPVSIREPAPLPTALRHA